MYDDFDPRKFVSKYGGSSGKIVPGAIYEAEVLHVASSSSTFQNLGYRKSGQASFSIGFLGIRVKNVSVANHSPMNPLVAGDRALVSFLDLEFKRCVCFGRLDNQTDVFIPLSDTDGKDGSRPAFTGTLTGQKITLTGTGTALNVTNHAEFGSINASSHNHTSDARAKTRIKPLTSALERIKRLVGVKYKRRTAAGTTEEFMTMDGYQYGLIAQDSASVIPSAVLYDPDKDTENAVGWSDAYGIDYGSVVPVLIEAVKELAERVEELENGQNPSSDVG